MTGDEDTEGASRRRDGFESARRDILRAMLGRAAFDGWTRPALAAAASDTGIDPATLAAAFPRGIDDILTFWSETLDEAMAAAMSGPAFEPLRTREKVAFAVRARLDLLRPHREAARRAAATLALPLHGALAARLAWRTADAIWRGLGDKSTDFNFYTKRAILTGVWTSTLARWFADDEPGEEATKAFLNARIENVMQFEKVKARLKNAGVDPSRAAGWLARRRYPAKDDMARRRHEDQKVDEALAESFPASDPPYFVGGGA